MLQSSRGKLPVCGPNKGEVEEALRLHQEQLEVYERLGDVQARAVTLGEIARPAGPQGRGGRSVAAASGASWKSTNAWGRCEHGRRPWGILPACGPDKGEVEEALRLHQEELEVCERLGDVQARAVTLGDIARLRAHKGEVDEALLLQQERLAINQNLGSLDGQAATLWDIAQIEFNRGDGEKAAPRVIEAYQIVDRLDRLDGICVIGVALGQLLIAAGERDRGLAVLRRSEQGYRRLQRYGDADRVAALIAKIEQG